MAYYVEDESALVSSRFGGFFLQIIGADARTSNYDRLSGVTCWKPGGTYRKATAKDFERFRVHMPPDFTATDLQEV